MALKLTRSILFAKDVTRLASFYRKALGLRELETEHPTEEWTLFDTGGAQLALHRIPDPWNADIEITDPPRVREGSPHKLVFEVDDMPKWRDALVAAGAISLDSERSNPPGEQLRHDFCDPEGNVFQISLP